MDSRQRLQRATRFFARPESFTLECPKCGTVYQCHAKKTTYWDPSTATFRCNRGHTACGRKYTIGIVAWPTYAGPGKASTPRDQVPGPRELAQLRREGGGWWMPDDDRQRYARPPETNLTTETERPDRDTDEEDT